MAWSVLSLILFLLILAGIPVVFYFMIRVTTLMQRIATELESISRSLQSQR